MWCPCCRSELTWGTPCRYETLVEHVMEPNGKAPVRETLMCSSRECPTYLAGIFWSHDGEGPYQGDSYNIEWIGGNSLPLGSIHREDNP